MKKGAPLKTQGVQKTSDEKKAPLKNQGLKRPPIKNELGAKPSFLERKKQSIHQNMKPKKPSSKYEVRCEAFIFQRKNKTFIKIWSQSVKPSSKYEAKESFIKIRRQRKLRQNTKAKKASSKYEVMSETFVFREKMKPSSKYEAKETFVKIWSHVWTFVFHRKNETFVEIRSQSVKPLLKYEAKETFVKIRSQRKLRQNMKAKKASSKYEVRYETFIFHGKNEAFIKIWSQRNLLSKYEVRYEAFIFCRKKRNLHRNLKSKCEAFIKIRRQRNLCWNMKSNWGLRQNTKAKKASSKYKVGCEAFVLSEKK
jgi:hypothetical protein